MKLVRTRENSREVATTIAPIEIEWSSGQFSADTEIHLNLAKMLAPLSESAPEGQL